MKQRLDGYLMESGSFSTKSKAQMAIKKGKVMFNGKVCTKPGKEVLESSKIVVENILDFVAEGGFKMEKALNDFNIKLTDKTALDVGTSFGGFTDCLLQFGAKLIFCVDTLPEVLHENIANDKRVKIIDNTSIQTLKKENIGNAQIDLITIDVSSISITNIIPYLAHFIEENGNIIATIKPKEEASSAMMGKEGLVKDLKTHIFLLHNVISFAQNHGLNLQNITYAPIENKRKNIEYMALFSKQNSPIIELEPMVKEALELHKKL